MLSVSCIRFRINPDYGNVAQTGMGKPYTVNMTPLLSERTLILECPSFLNHTIAHAEFTEDFESLYICPTTLTYDD